MSLEHNLCFPEGFDSYAWEVEEKGWFADAILCAGGHRYRLTFYDPSRLAQDVADTLDSGGHFFQENIVVVSRVSRPEMEKAARSIVSSMTFTHMVCEDGS